MLEARDGCASYNLYSRRVVHHNNIMSTRRKSTVSISRAREHVDDSPARELERLEQETTLVLQEIDHNLLRANNVINDKMFPALKKYAAATGDVWTNVGFWKHFFEEAADVEISTFDEKPPPAHPPVEETPSPQPSSQQLEASTPQLRSRTLAASQPSPQILTMRKLALGYLKVAVLPRKRTPRRTDEHSRLSALPDFLNSSPTLPEPPVLLSEIGRATTTSSSSAVRARAGLLSSSEANRDLGRLLPVAFPTMLLTPGQNRPYMPNFSSSALRARAASTHGSPVRRDDPSFLNDSDLAVPKAAAFPAALADESDELLLPRLQSVPDTRGTPGGTPASAKRRRLSARDDDNVFLDKNTSRNSTVYHTMAQDADVRDSRSMLTLFDELLPGAASEAAHSPAVKSPAANSPAAKSLNAARSPNAGHAADPAARTEAPNLSLTIDSTVDSSELGPLWGERWKLLSKALRKP